MNPSRPSGFLKSAWTAFFFIQLACGAAFAANHVVAWGDNTYGETNVPPGATNVQMVAAGRTYCLALKGDSTVVAWGTSAATNIPSGLSNVVSIAAGGGQCLALKSNGTLVAWGAPSTTATTNIPAGLSNILAIACGDDHDLVLESNGTIYAWGENYSHQTNILAGLSNVVAIAAGDSASLAIKSDGTVWCTSGFPTGVASLSNIVAGALVSGGEEGGFIGRDGAARVWNDEGGLTVVSNVVQVNGRSGFNQAGATWALQRNGTLAGFALSPSLLGQSNVWMNLSNVLSVAAGYNYHLAIVGDTLPAPVPPMTSAIFTNGQFLIAQPTSIGRNYRLEYLDTFGGNWQIISPLPGNGSTQTLVDPNPNPQQRFYRVRAGQ